MKLRTCPAPAEQLAQEPQLRPGQPSVLADHPLDVLHLEDRVRQDWAGLMDLLGQPGSLRLLGLDDPHPELGGQVLAAVQAAWVATLQERPGALEVAKRDLQLGELRLVAAELMAEVRDV